MARVTPSLTGRRSTPAWLVAVLALTLVAGLWWVATRDGQAGLPGGPAARSTATAPAPAPAPLGGTAAPSTTPDGGLSFVAESSLPAEARATLELIRSGGPYPYGQDDRTFQNRERTLPQRQRGYYREYTVETPGSDDRGARRIVAGRAGDRYWTDDHYDTFRQIQEGQ